MGRSGIQTAILGDDSVAVFNERTQRMLSLNRTAAYLWFRHGEVDHGELAADLAARTGMDLADAKRTIDEHIATWKAAGFIPSDDANDVAALADLATTSQSTADEPRLTEQIGRAPAASLFGRLAGMNFCIRYEPDELRQLLEPALQHLVGPACSPDLAIDVRRDEAGWTVRDGTRVVAGGLRTNEVVPVVIYGLLDGLLRRSANSIAFHASAARRNGRCVLLAAPAGSGKSTLCAALLSRGYEFIADDVVLVDGMTLGLRGVPLPVSLKIGSWSPLMNAYPQLEVAAVHLRPDGKAVKFLVPPAIAPADESHAVAAVIFPRFISGTEVELRGVDQSLALHRLVSEASTPSLRLSADRFADLASFLRPTSCWELRFSALAPAVDAIDQICR
ncbi:MAG TPA: PqqD family peptide modification chaperone [Stellaceae bacterium]|nr:PqqD family peptide modification chaperone [Stellaceae bacterium]